MKLNLYTRILGKAIYLKDKVNKKVNLDLYYLIRLECSNCGSCWEVYIKKGTYITDAKRYMKCINCGCKVK